MTFCAPFASVILEAANPVAVGPVGNDVNPDGLSRLGSPHRVNEMAQSHFRNSRSQSSQPTIGEYQSRPHANVVRTVVKLAM